MRYQGQKSLNLMTTKTMHTFKTWGKTRCDV